MPRTRTVLGRTISTYRPGIDRQPFVVHPLAVGLDDLGVEDDHRSLVEVPHEDLLLHADLRGRQREAVVRLVQRVEHVVDEP